MRALLCRDYEMSLNRCQVIVLGIDDHKVPSIGAQPLIYEREKNCQGSPPLRLEFRMDVGPWPPRFRRVIDGHPAMTVDRDRGEKIAPQNGIEAHCHAMRS